MDPRVGPGLHADVAVGTLVAVGVVVSLDVILARTGRFRGLPLAPSLALLFPRRRRFPLPPRGGVAVGRPPRRRRGARHDRGVVRWRRVRGRNGVRNWVWSLRRNSIHFKNILENCKEMMIKIFKI